MLVTLLWRSDMPFLIVHIVLPKFLYLFGSGHTRDRGYTRGDHTCVRRLTVASARSVAVDGEFGILVEFGNGFTVKVFIAGVPIECNVA